MAATILSFCGVVITVESVVHLFADLMRWRTFRCHRKLATTVLQTTKSLAWHAVKPITECRWPVDHPSLVSLTSNTFKEQVRLTCARKVLQTVNCSSMSNTQSIRAWEHLKDCHSRFSRRQHRLPRSQRHHQHIPLRLTTTAKPSPTRIQIITTTNK